MSRVDEIRGIERLEGQGITAKVTDDGKQYTSYQNFADSVGYPDATGYGKGAELQAIINEEFKVLAKGKHESYDTTIFVIESDRGQRFLIGEDGLDIKGESPSLETRKDIEELIAEMRRQAYAEGYEQGFKQAKFDAEMDEQFRKVGEVVSKAGITLKETSQGTRDRIVEQAKADILELIPEDSGYDGIYYRVVKNNEEFVCSADFVVNKEKRTVVVLMKGWFNGEVLAKGIAKCAPDDCFNAHIGKAIAIRRALGLEVPGEYLNAPQPTEVRVADIIEWEYSKRRYGVIGIRRGVLYNFINIVSGERFYDLEYRNLNSITKIIDDSESIAP